MLSIASYDRFSIQRDRFSTALLKECFRNA